MRRLMSVVLATLVAAILLVPATVAVAAPVAPPAAEQVVVLAAEGGGEGEPAGVEPNLESTNAPADYEPPFLINAAYGLVGLVLLIVAAVGGLYYLLVQRPKAAGKA